jgi:competence protein ComFC
MLQPTWLAFMDVLFHACAACASSTAAGRRCVRAGSARSAKNALPLVEPPYCKVCGEVYDGAFTNEFRCMRTAAGGSWSLISPWRPAARKAVRELIHQFKYERRLQLRGALAALMLRTLEEPRLAQENLADWLLVPVPLHRSRERTASSTKAGSSASGSRS